MPSYREFLESKAVIAPERGYAGPVNLNPSLKPHARDIAAWMIRGGARACFASFGLHKTSIQLQVCESLLDVYPGESALIVCPLGVRREFVKEQVARGFKRAPLYVRTNEEYEAARVEGHELFLTNYERVRDGGIDPNRFMVCSLDEAAVLRSFGSKTYQTFLPLFDRVRFKFVATATPSPNRFKELIHYAGFLGVMDTGQALTRFFKRDSSQAGNLQLHPHKEREFWVWVSTWATFITKPSDMGYSDEGYILPPLNIHRHRLPVDHASAGFDSWGQGKLLRNAAVSLSDAAREKRDSIDSRLSRLLQIIDGLQYDARRIQSQVLPGEQGSGEVEVSGVLPSDCQGSPGQGEAARIHAGIQPHPQEATDDAGRERGTQSPSEGEVSLRSGIQGATARSGERLAARQPGEKESATSPGLPTDASGVREDALGPGRGLCDLQDSPHREEHETSRLSVRGPQPQDRQSPWPALLELQQGYREPKGQPRNSLGRNRLSHQIIIWCDLNSEQDAIEIALASVGVSFTSLRGADSIEERERELERWLNGDTDILLTKLSLYGYGANLQQCHIEIFFGVSYKFADFKQGVARVQRFGQSHEVDLHLIYTESEDPVYEALMAKWKQHDELHATMAQIIKEFGLNQAKANTEMQRSIGIERREERGELFTAVNNDNVLELQRMADDSVDFILSSWPFSDHYEYTESYNDFGHNDGDAGFFEQMEYLTPEVLRVLAPGRMYCVHAKDRIVYGSVSGDGMYTVNPFSDKCVEHLRRHGFRYCGRITVVTDVVRENNQTYRLGWTENSKDGTKMGVGSPEYVLLFRKLPTDTANAYADVPVTKPKEDYTRARWQFDAHSLWRSSGNRFLRPEEIASIPMDQLRRLWHQYSKAQVYDFGEHVSIAEEMEKRGILPSSFMALDPPNPGAPNVWDDVTRMRTLNGEQAAKGREMHVCPLQLDIVERLIERYSNRGELVMDPFGGLGTVAYCAVLSGRRGYTVELNHGYWRDSVAYCRGAEQKVGAPTLFDLMGGEDAA
jgi:hypothetical protein